MRGERYLWSVVGTLGGRRFRDRIAAQASKYWSTPQGREWETNSHWRDALGDDGFEEIGREHRDIFDDFARALDVPVDGGTVIEWGCGGGANAVAFAPRADRFIGADISIESLAECERQVRNVCDTDVDMRLIDLERPEEAAHGLEGACSAFLCLYVIEVTTGPDEVRRILRIARELLTHDGLALVQMKYHTIETRTHGRPGMRYERNIASTTTFAIDEFWDLARECGLQPSLVRVVPETRYDVRYAYFAMTKVS